MKILKFLKNREFSKAITLCMKNEKLMAKYEHLKCIKYLLKEIEVEMILRDNNNHMI